MASKNWNKARLLKAVERLNAIDSIPWPNALGESSSKKKQELLALARSGTKRPKEKTSLGGALYHYTNPNDPLYDIAFDKEIRSLRPDWFVNRTEEANKKKEELLRLARLGVKRKDLPRNLEKCFSLYTSPSSGTYDIEFEKAIMEKVDWKNKSKYTKKQVLEEAARLGKLFSLKNHSHRSKIFAYMSKNNASYDSSFQEALKKLCPHLFAKSSSIKKAELIKMAKSGKSKPSRNTKIGMALSSYTSKSSKAYDSEFDKQIRALRPDWFKS